MDPIEKRELKRQAWMRLAAQRRRAGLLRGRVVVVSVICFVVLWGVVFAQMATGNDPALSAKTKVVATTDAKAKTKAAARRIAKAKARPREEEVVEAEPQAEEEIVEEPEPEFVEEPLVTSQS
jgi:non-ribosomal peptide synthetase component E (peptide arylation enzyme)